MQKFALVCPILKELEGLSRSQFLKIVLLFSGITSLWLPSSDKLKAHASLPFFPVRTPWYIRSFQCDAQQHVLALVLSVLLSFLYATRKT